MDLKALRYFLAVAQLGNVTAASRALFVTQPTLSRQLQDLEESLGTVLFTRSKQGMRLTEDGVQLQKMAQEIIDLAEKTQEHFQHRETLAGGIYIAAGETIQMRPIADLLAEMHREHPDISLHLFSGNAAQVAERLDKGLADFGVFIGAPQVAHYASLRMPKPDCWGVLMRADAPLSAKTQIQAADLIGQNVIVSEQTHIGGALLDWLAAAQPRIVCRYNLIYNAALMVQAGLGYALTLAGLTGISGSSAGNDAGNETDSSTENKTENSKEKNAGSNAEKDTARRAEELLFRPLAPALKIPVDFVWRENALFSPAAAYFLEEAKARWEKAD